jgi:hypothetical protein
MLWLLRVLAVFYLLPAGYVLFWVMQSLPPELGSIDWLVAISSVAAFVLGVCVWLLLEVLAKRGD